MVYEAPADAALIGSRGSSHMYVVYVMLARPTPDAMPTEPLTAVTATERAIKGNE